MKFYVVRHGQTYFNITENMQGWCDSPLTELGIAQAKARKELLKDIPFDAAISSTQERAMDTCKILMEGRDIPYVAYKELKEMHFGTYEGALWKDVKNPEMEENFETYFKQYGGENTEDVRKRFFGKLAEIAETEDYENVLVIGHGNSIRYCIGYLDHEFYTSHLDGEFLNNCGLCVLEYKDGTFTLIDIDNKKI